MKMVTMLGVDDWEALYINGAKVLENHRLSGQEILETLIDNGVVEGDLHEVEDELLESFGGMFPNQLPDCY